MPERQPWERRSGAGGLVAIGGGVLVVLATFMTWMSFQGFGISGWDLVDADRRPSGNFLVIGEAFQDGFNPFVTGAVGLLFGVLLVVVGIVLFVVPKRPPPAALSVHPAVVIPALLGGIVALLVLLGNVVTIVRSSFVEVSPGIGLILAIVGVIAGLVGVVLASIGGGRAAARPAPAGAYPTGAPAAVPPPSTAPMAQPANWYPDPLARHEFRYWDGQVWTGQVSDGGAVGDDPPAGA